MTTTEPVFLSVDADVERAVEPLRALVAVLDRLGYTQTARLPIGGGRIQVVMDPANLAAFVRGSSNLFHRSAVPGLYRWLLARRHRQAVELHDLLTVGRPQPGDRVRDLLGSDLVDRLVEVGALADEGGTLRSNVLVAAVAGGIYFSDPPHLSDHPDYAYVGRSTFTAPLLAMQPPIARRAASDAPRRVIDLGCGSGIGAAMLGVAGFEQVVGTDIVERCLSYARLNAAVNRLPDAQFGYSDVFEDVSGTFDVVVLNAPCAWEELQRATFASGGGEFGTALPVRMLQDSIDHLRPGGTVIAVLQAPYLNGRPAVTDVIERAIGNRPVRAHIQPMFAEYEAEWAPIYRRHGVSRFERYVVTITGAARPTVELGREFGLRYRCSRLLAAIIRARTARHGDDAPTENGHR